MCGIFGIIVKNDSTYTEKFLKKSLQILAKLSESRGKDSSGFCVLDLKQQQISVLKGPIPVTELLAAKSIQQSLRNTFVQTNSKQCIYAFGHARLVTNGSQLNDDNNQPTVKDGIIGVHNGIVVNADELWQENPELKRAYDIDTEVMLSLIRLHLNNDNTIQSSVSKAINSISGTVSTALAFNNIDKIVLATNNGSLYIIHNSRDILFFASEKYILEALNKKVYLQKKIGDFKLIKLLPNTGYTIDLLNFELENFLFDLPGTKLLKKEANCSPKSIIVKNFKSSKKQVSTVIDINKIHLNPNADREQALLKYPIGKIKILRRCSKCILPETFPFIEYDQLGVCNYCRNYKQKNQPKSISELIELVAPFRNKDGSPDVLIPLSGGRDSIYVLHVVKKVLGLNPIAFTYDWGMVTDLARRNIARICGKLGVENIIVAAEIHWKRENIRKNIKAWLKNPDLGMIPLFMAGDKFFFYYANKIKKQTNIKLNIWGINYLENTDFKTGFAGLAPQFNKKTIYSLSKNNQLKLFKFVGKNVIKSPEYINQSLMDSVGSFASRYISPKSDYYHLFDYMRWDEKEIEDTIINEYQWETAIDTKSTWRIGDGTASFYNYIYTLAVGFSENDTFRSNQIREGMISREEALNLVYEENKPRYNSLKWYLEIVGLDFETTIKTINNIPSKI